jgi:hypothetical protein
MKNIYTKTCLLLFSFILQSYLSESVHAQCLCAGGLPATPIRQSITIPATTTSILNFNFNRFDPSIGTLTCVRLNDTISGITTTGALNTADSTIGYKFQLTLSNNISGPGISIDQDASKIYGPDTLKPYGNPADTITYGPDPIFTNSAGTAQTTGNAAYIGGAGTKVNFAYTINGGMVALKGGLNYKSGISTIIGGTIALTYYWCPASLLASGLQHFSALKKDNNIILKWDAQNAPEIDQFDIEYSIDGIAFTAVAKLPANHSAAATTYNYSYALNGSSSGYVYFRIKQTGNDNKAGYSAIQKILLNEKTSLGISIHPNPVTTGMSIAFDRPLNGDYSVDLVNLSGQVVVNKKMKLMNSNTIPVSWSSKPAPGIYFTRITNTNSMEQQVIRVIIQ